MDGMWTSIFATLNLTKENKCLQWGNGSIDGIVNEVKAMNEEERRKEYYRSEEFRRKDANIVNALIVFAILSIIFVFVLFYKMGNTPSERPGFKDMGTYGDRPQDDYNSPYFD